MKKDTIFLLSFLSGLLYLLPFFFPYTLYWTMLFCMVPLYANIFSYQKKEIMGGKFLFSGLFWCLFVLSVHLAWFWKLLYFAGSSSRVYFGLITLGYFSLIMMVPFFTVFLLKEKKWLSICLFTFTFSMSIYVISYKSFLIFGRNEGYSFFDPILPFMSQVKLKECNSTFALLCPALLQGSASHRAHQIATYIARESLEKNETCVIILPESTFPYNLEEYSEFLPVWCDCHENIHIIIGSHLRENEKTYNCAYHIYNGVIIQKYFKMHLVPFFESIPEMFDNYSLGEVFTSRTKVFSCPSNEKNNDVFFINGNKYQLFICSELYQYAKPVKKNMPVLFIGNNSWFMSKYAQTLTELAINYFSWWNDCLVISCIKRQ